MWQSYTFDEDTISGDVYTCAAVYTAAADHTCAVDHGAAAGLPIGILCDPTWGSLGSPKGSHRSPYEASVAALLHCYFVTLLLCSFEPTPVTERKVTEEYTLNLSEIKIQTAKKDKNKPRTEPLRGNQKSTKNM